MGKIVSKTEFKAIIKPILSPYWATGKDNFIGFSDNKYFLPDNEELNNFIEFNKKHLDGKFIPEVYDCDDFSFITRANSSNYFKQSFSIIGSFALGIAWGKFTWINEFHATNWVINENHEFFWYEPQTHNFYRYNSCVKGLRLFLT